jgi:hypothetical protein
MKKPLLLGAAFILASTSFAQKSMSKAEAMVNTPDQAMQREFVTIGTLNHVNIIVEHIANTSTKEKIVALDLEYKMPEEGPTFSVLLDADEMDALIAFIKSAKDEIPKSSLPKNYMEYSFISKSGFEAGCYWDKEWKAYLKIDKDDSKTDVELSRSDLNDLLSALKDAKDKMEQ